MRYSSRLLLTLMAIVALAGAGCTKQARMARHMQKADRYFAEGDYDHADAEYVSALGFDPLAKNPNSARAYFRIGVMSMEQGRIRRAFRPLVKAVQMDTNNIEYHDKLGAFYLGLGMLKEARDEANFVLERQ